MKVLPLILLSFLFTGCSNLKIATHTMSSHPLKSQKDINIEKTLTNGEWKYKRQYDDCKDTSWTQTFYKNRYYKSVGDACLIPNAFSVDAENWHIKYQTLYITNLSPVKGDDIILKYRIDYLSNKKLILNSGNYQYTFFR